MEESDRWVTLAFTWSGLRALGVPDDSLATFPDEFREGMASRATILGDTGPNAPEHWGGGLAGDDLHAIAILFARNDDQCERSIAEHDKLLARTWISTRHHRSTMPTTTSASVTGCRSR
jgi:hypothetical protein